MKYIKLFEKKSEWHKKIFFRDLKIGDYVMVNLFQLEKEKSIPHKITILPTFNNSAYYGERINGKNEIFFNDDIDRIMTPEEIEQFELDKTANKYNI